MTFDFTAVAVGERTRETLTEALLGCVEGAGVRSTAWPVKVNIGYSATDVESYVKAHSGEAGETM